VGIPCFNGVRGIWLNMSMQELASTKGCLFVLLLGVILQVSAFSQDLPDAPSIIQITSLSASELPDSPSDPPQASDTAPEVPSNSKFLTRWAKHKKKNPD